MIVGDTLWFPLSRHGSMDQHFAKRESSANSNFWNIHREREGERDRQTDRQKKDDSIGWKGGKRITSD